MKQLAATIRDRLDALATAYCQRLQAIDGFASLADADQLCSARRELDLIAGCLEAGDNQAFLECVADQASARTGNGFDATASMQALNALEETLMPLVRRVEEAKFLWRTLAQVRTVVTNHQQKQAEERSQQLARAVEATNDAVIITDTTGAIQFVNPAFEKNTGYSRAEVIGQNPRILKSGLQSEDFYAEMWGAIASGQVWQGDVTNRR
jgi:PAS domain-containing protein